MNLTLSLGIDDGAAAKKKLKVRDGGVDDVGGCGAGAVRGGERGSGVAWLLLARGEDDRMVKAEEGYDDGGGNGMTGTTSGDGSGLELVQLLLSAVAAGEVGDVHAAAAALQEVYRRASFRRGDPAQRVAGYYADELASRLTGLRSSLVRSSAPPVTRVERFLSFTMFYQASPFYQFAHFTANQAIVEAFEAGGRRRLHVVDFDVSYGFQWPSLIQSLSDAAAAASSSHNDGVCDGPVSLRITGFGASADELRETEARLARFAASCHNLLFEFEGILRMRGSNSLHDCIKVEDDATVVVNLMFPATQNAPTSSREPCPATMAYIHSLNPSMVVLIEKHDGGGHNATTRRCASLLPRFAANLRYFAAVFDSLHECLPADSAERLAIERNHLGREISNAVASFDDHRHGASDQHEASQTSSWKETMESAGFEGMRLSSRAVSQAKLLLKMKSGYGGGFHVVVVEGDDGVMALSLAWRDLALLTATEWRRRCR
ncbi:hypothetical protein GUJ93_ZPchr0014g47262 [Zizania palustris]|uniref:Uncharacterized protein n=1 Tax=Zizania palustris TaxID=103762 RepID=A0A8J5VRS5_ZIZPA|nr:hypothetical protein GUJ93_ZPchr0014g47262 [Zizania palustris]